MNNRKVWEKRRKKKRMVRSLYVRRDTTYVEQHDPLITGEISRQEPDERLLLDIHRATRCLDG